MIFFFFFGYIQVSYCGTWSWSYKTSSFKGRPGGHWEDNNPYCSCCCKSEICLPEHLVLGFFFFFFQLNKINRYLSNLRCFILLNIRNHLWFSEHTWGDHLWADCFLIKWLLNVMKEQCFLHLLESSTYGLFPQSLLIFFTFLCSSTTPPCL